MDRSVEEDPKLAAAQAWGYAQRARQRGDLETAARAEASAEALEDQIAARAAKARAQLNSSSTPTTGGTAVSIEDIRSAVAEVEQRVSTAAHQLHTVRGELDEAAGLLAQLSQGSNAAELSDALGVLRDLSSELEQAGQRAIHTGESALAYAGRL